MRIEFELRKKFKFEAAHFLPELPQDHKCRRIHGHSFEVEVVVSGPYNESYGWVVDYGEITMVVKPLIDQLDHRLLNEISGLENPTSENIARWLWNQIKPKLPWLSEIIVAETCTSRCIYRGIDTPIGMERVGHNVPMIIDLQKLQPLPCPCGISRRAFIDVNNAPASVHMTEINGEPPLHFHKNHTEIYIAIEGQGFIELNNQRMEFKPYMAVLIPPGCLHRAIGQMRILNIVIPPFDPVDEYME